MVDKLMYILHKITPSVNQNQWLKRLNTQLNETINPQRIVKATSKKT